MRRRPFYKSVGCDQCNHTGYRGRIGIYEVLALPMLRRAIAERASKHRYGHRAERHDHTGEDGLAKVKSGVTTPEELLPSSPSLREVRTLCTSCGAAVGVDFVACPQCGKRQGGGCRTAGGRCSPGGTCPYCARSTELKRDGSACANGAARRDHTRAAGRKRRRIQEVVCGGKTHYEHLELPSTATADEIKRSFRR
jgi:hypothetical protein